jgi:ABC-2 type transport system ATP-binding protein
MANGETPSIIIEKLSKHYPGAAAYALKDLSLKIMPGEIYGFLGPNGAGKTTTIRLLMNFIQPTKGRASILGNDIVNGSVAIKKSVGYLSGDPALYPKMTGRQFLSYMKALQPPKHPNYINELARRFSVDLNLRVGNLSKGNFQKVGIVQAFMHEPDVLILDEPTGGLDPLMQEKFYELVKETKDRGACLFVSSHNLTEVQKMCDRVGFIRRGKLIAEQTLADLTKEATQTFDIGFVEAIPMTELKHLSKAKITKNSEHHITIHVHGELSDLFAVLARHKVNSITQREANLEEDFLRFYREDEEDEAAN